MVIGEINSGGNRGNTIEVGDIGGGGLRRVRSPARSRSTVATSTTARTSTSTPAVARPSRDASGGSGNLAVAAGNDDGVAVAVHRSAAATVSAPVAMAGYGGDVASAGNGGVAGVSADGGIVVIDEINSGGNQGNTIEVGDICAAPAPVYVPAKPGEAGQAGEAGQDHLGPVRQSRVEAVGRQGSGDASPLDGRRPYSDLTGSGDHDPVRCTAGVARGRGRRGPDEDDTIR